jgi:hypothetical protein
MWRKTFLSCALAVLLGSGFFGPVHADDLDQTSKTIDMPIDLPALAEVDALDHEDAAIRRFFMTSQGMRGQTVPIDGTSGWFCVLSQDTHTMLDYWPELDLWVFQIGFDEEAELTAGGLATCHRLAQ